MVILLVASPVIAWTVVNTKTCEETCTYADRSFKPAHWYYWTEYHCMIHDKSGSCTFSIPIQHQDWIPDRWWIRYRDILGNLDGWERVGQALYDQPPQIVAH